ncbi:M48 family metalloprotease [Echinicola jeungdonensis]|uniref:M48 family metalloprotease n=1 Tax=Echinicola jeungdonensis TaxID=709343 RepID=UPI0025B3887D|nr:M48 family metalloprotease [Echinicola jeungdonensis]MDN3671295.1 M48 family metalloprotease [Echinicola jeungdonensis]
MEANGPLRQMPFFRFWQKKKVVLFDTLVEQHKPEELVAVLAHEIGHFKKSTSSKAW